MSLPYFPMYPDDFEADTAHLSLLEDGAYNRLLRLCWRSPGCSVPNDEAWIMRRMRVTDPAEMDAVRAVLAEYFTVEKGRYTNKRLSREWREAHDAHEKRKMAGSKGGKAKALKLNNSEPSNAQAMLKQCSSNQNQNQNQNHKEKTPPIGGAKKTGSRLPEDWTLPTDWRVWAVSEGMMEIDVQREAAKFRDYWIAKSGKDASKRDWQATWRNWIRKAMQDRTPRSQQGKPQPGEVREIRGQRHVYRAYDGWVPEYA